MDIAQAGDLDLKLLEKSESSLKIADHMAYIVYPLLKDNKLIKKVLDEVSNSTINLINSILSFEHKIHRLRLTQDKRENIALFKNVSEQIGLSFEETKNLIESLELSDMHKRSSFECMRSNNILITTESGNELVSLDKLKSHINTLKFRIQKFKNYSEKLRKPIQHSSIY